MDNTFSTSVIAKHAATQARVTTTNTPHGTFTTPAFMPVGTRAAVNCMTPEMITQTQSDIILGGNTYHMLVSPGLEVIEAAGGMHRFMAWPKPMLTDSGGFQVFSLSRNSKICRIDEQGAHFKHPSSGKIVHLTPESSIQAQKIIGADIIMAFDECTPESGGRLAAVAAMERTHRWLAESKESHLRNPKSAYGFHQALFGIIQGGSYQDLREESLRKVLDMELDGIAIGGEVIGFDMAKTQEVLSWLTPELPEQQLRYTMGVGLQPQDLIDVVKHGIDIFDCVAPTRNARHGSLYHGYAEPEGDWVKFSSQEPRNRILIKKAIYAKDDQPILPGCECYTCRNYSRAHLHFLFKEKHALYAPLACTHNIHVMQHTCKVMQTVIQKDNA